MSARWGFLPLLLLALVTLQRISVPPAVDQLDLEPGTTEAVLGHLEVIAAEPHPIATPAHAAVRQYLIDEIEELGLRAEVQQATLGSVEGSVLRWAEPDVVLNNVMTRIAGSGNGKAVVLVSHYDSAPDSPGAGDDGAAVASMLDLLARSMEGGFTNDVIFLFTDAEENCLCGARTFVRTHPWAQDIGVVLNFEARGSSGKSVMFELTEGYGNLIGAYAANARHPATSSLYQLVYELLPRDTDLTAFREQGKHAMNMALIDAQHNNHVVDDTVENLDMRGVMHQYANMQAMLLAFANADLEQIHAGNPIFFDVLGLAVFVYGPELAYAMAAAAVVLLVILMHGSFKVGTLRVQPLALALLVFVAAAVIVMWGVDALSGLLMEEGATAGPMKKYHLGAAIVTAMFIFGVMLQVAARRIGEVPVAFAIYLVWLSLLVVTSALISKASYIFLWPLIGVLIARSLRVRSEAGRQVLVVLAFAPLVILWTQLGYGLLLAMSSVWIVVAPMLLAAGLMQTFRFAPGLQEGKAQP